MTNERTEPEASPTDARGEMEALRREIASLRAALLAQSTALGGTPPPESAKLRSDDGATPWRDTLVQILFEEGPDGVAVLGLDARIAFMSRPGAKLLAGAPEDLIGRSLLDLLAGRNRKEALDRLLEAARSELPTSIEFKIRRLDGAVRWFSTTARLVSRSGKVVGVAASFRDVTRQQTEAIRHRDNEALLDAAEAIAQVGSWAAGPTPDAPIMWTRGCAKLFGCAYDAPPTASGFMQFVHPDDRDYIISTAVRAIADGVPCETRHRIVRPDGSIRHVHAKAFVSGALRWTDGEAYLDESHAEDSPAYTSVGVIRDITDQRSLEDERDGFLNLSLDLLCIAGQDGYFRRLNPAWQATLGWTLEELCARPWLDFVHPDDIESTIAEGAALGRGERTVRFENRYRHKDGGYRRLQWTAIPSTEYGTIYGIAHDVTDERAAAERDRLLFDANPIPIWLTDAETLAITRTNDAASTQYGFSAHEFAALTLHDLVAAEELTTLDEWTRCLRPGDTVERPCRYLTRAGAVRETEVTAGCIEVGGRRSILMVNVDVTDRRRAQEELRASERSYRRIVDNASEGIWMYDEEGRTTFVNPSMAEMLGASVPELLGSSILDYLHPDERDRARERLALRKAGLRDRAEMRLRRKDETDLWVSLHTAPVFDETGRFDYALALVANITEQRRSEHALKRSEDQLRQSQKMEAIGALAGGIAHDFNNLLSIILSYTSMLVEDLAEQDPMRVDLAEVHDAGLRAAELTKQLLAFSRRQILQPAVVDLNGVVLGMKRMLQRILGEDISLSLLTSTDPIRVFADPSQLEQVVLNLAVNARDAMPRGGSLSVETASVDVDESFGTEHARMTPGSYALLAVSDTGIGMSPETQARIFEPFFTTKDKSKGTGLGLSTVYGIVKQSGGNIWVYSELGVGTTFKVYLPRTDRMPSESVGEGEPLVEDLHGNETILLVEDDDAVRTMVRTILRKSGYNVLEASNGGEAFLLCEQFQATIHLLLTDVVMPRMSGRQLANRLLMLRPEMKVLYVSGYTENTIVHHGILDAGIEFLAKPLLPGPLLRKVRQLLGGRSGPTSRRTRS